MKSSTKNTFKDKKRIWIEIDNICENLIKIYFNKFNIIRKSRPKVCFDQINEFNLNGIDRFDISKYNNWEDFKKFIDYVDGQFYLKEINSKKIDIIPHLKTDNIEIYFGDTMEKCIQIIGEINYNWCISTPIHKNYFHFYRAYHNEPIYYFVKNIKKYNNEIINNNIINKSFKDKYHFFVIQIDKHIKINNLEDKNYIIIDVTNTQIKINWNELLKIEPDLINFKEHLIPKKLTLFEIKLYDKFKKVISNDDFKKLNYVDKDLYMLIQSKFNNGITDMQFMYLPHELKCKYIRIHKIRISSEQYKIIEQNQELYNIYKNSFNLKLLDWVKNNNIIELADFEIDVLTKDLLFSICNNNIIQLIKKTKNNKEIINKILNSFHEDRINDILSKL